MTTSLPRPALAIGLLLASAVSSAIGQTPDATNAKAKAALSKQQGDVDPTQQIKETLTASQPEYSLLAKGKHALSYAASYTYIGRERINAEFGGGSLTLFNISNESQHTVNNTLSAELGLLDNVTVSGALPIIGTYAQNSRAPGLSHSFGDVSVGLRWQPFVVSKQAPTATINASLRTPTGKSPFKGFADTGEASGSGLWQGNLGVNVSKVFDPVALFGSLTFGMSKPATKLSQVRGTRTLAEVKPGQSIGFGFGMAHALSYSVSTSISFQETFSRATLLSFSDGSSLRTQSQTSAVLAFGLGVRLTPQTLVNLQVGVGLTSDSPNLSLDFSVPLRF